MNTKPAGWAWALLWTGLALTYFVMARLCVSASAVVANVSWMPFIPAGLALTTALLWGRNVWPGVLVGEFASALASGEPLGASLAMATGNALECGLAGWWFHDRLGRRIEFDRLKDVAALLVAELLVLQPLSATMGMIGLLAGGQITLAQLSASASAWYASNLLAVFVIAPAAIVWIRWSRPAVSRSQALELGALVAVTLLAGAFWAARWESREVPLFVALIAAVPLLVWAAVRFVPSVAITLGSTLGLFAFGAELAGYGPFKQTAGAEGMFSLNVFMGVCIGTSLFLASAMGDQRRQEAERQRLIAELRGALAQVKRLEEFVTFCAWTGRVRLDGEWVSVENFLHDRFNISVTHGISDAGLAMLRESMPPKHPPSPPSPPTAPS